MDVTIPLWAAIITGILGAVGGGAGIAALWNSHTKAKNSTVDRLRDHIDDLWEEIGRMKKRTKTQQETIDAQAKKIEDLQKQVQKWKSKYNEICRWVENQFGVQPFEEIDENGGEE